jgi:hypothetical protein
MIRYYHCNSTGVSFVLKIPLVLKAKGTSTYRGDRRSLYHELYAHSSISIECHVTFQSIVGCKLEKYLSGCYSMGGL